MVSITQISTATDLSALNGTKAAVNTPAATDADQSAAVTNATKLKNQFLSILLTQMQHQNPLDPMDTKEFTAQLTQFSSLEQQIDTNSKLDGLLGSLKQSSVANSLGYMGQYVDINSNQGAYQDGMANWTYSLPTAAKSIGVSVTDDKGNVVYSSTLATPDGRTDINPGTFQFGLTAADLPTGFPEGTSLKLTLTAKDAAGNAITTAAHTTVRVDSVQADANGSYIQAGDVLYNLSDISRIVKAPTKPTTPTDTADSTDTTDTTPTA